jgi:hypothetical protein
MSELSFLLTLLLEHKLNKPTKLLILERVKELESKTTSRPVPTQITVRPVSLPAPVETIGQTPQAQKALADRQEAIAQAMAGKKPTGYKVQPK